jgi:hypothetical protein
LIYLDNLFEYKKYIQKVLLQFCKTGLQVNIKKYKFNITCTKYLDFVINTNSIKVNLKKVKVIWN